MAYAYRRDLWRAENGPSILSFSTGMYVEATGRPRLPDVRQRKSIVAQKSRTILRASMRREEETAEPFSREKPNVGAAEGWVWGPRRGEEPFCVTTDQHSGTTLPLERWFNVMEKTQIKINNEKCPSRCYGLTAKISDSVSGVRGSTHRWCGLAPKSEVSNHAHLVELKLGIDGVFLGRGHPGDPLSFVALLRHEHVVVYLIFHCNRYQTYTHAYAPLFPEISNECNKQPSVFGGENGAASHSSTGTKRFTHTRILGSAPSGSIRAVISHQQGQHHPP